MFNIFYAILIHKPFDGLTDYAWYRKWYGRCWFRCKVDYYGGMPPEAGTTTFWVNGSTWRKCNEEAEARQGWMILPTWSVIDFEMYQGDGPTIYPMGHKLAR